MNTSSRQYIAAASLGLALLIGGAGRAGAQDTTPSTQPASSAVTTTPPMTHSDAATPTSADTDTTVDDDDAKDPFGDSLVEPNSGKEPENSGERGTWPQYAVMGGVILGLVIIGLIARREMRAGKVREGRDPDAGNV